MRFSRISIIVPAILVAVVLTLDVPAQRADVTDFLSRHRASIGTPSALSSVKNQLILSNAQFTFKGSTNVILGKALILSTNERTLWGMNFTSNDYPQDRFGFDGKNVKVARSTPSARSLIGDFLDKNRTILRDGLLGGALNASWPLLHAQLRGARISLDGTKGIDGREAIVYKYDPKGGSDLSIKLYFDAKTAQHVRTEYLLIRAAAQGSDVDNSAGQSGTIYKLVEEFSGFAKMGELLLPGSYKVTYSRTTTAGIASSQAANRDAEWQFNVTEVGFNRDYDAGAFNVDQK
jgi:hypothetical protein